MATEVVLKYPLSVGRWLIEDAWAQLFTQIMRLKLAEKWYGLTSIVIDVIPLLACAAIAI